MTIIELILKQMSLRLTSEPLVFHINITCHKSLFNMQVQYNVIKGKYMRHNHLYGHGFMHIISINFCWSLLILLFFRGNLFIWAAGTVECSISSLMTIWSPYNSGFSCGNHTFTVTMNCGVLTDTVATPLHQSIF